MPAYIIDLSALEACNAAVVGHKAANLATMLHAGFPVPPGFVLTTHAFALALTAVERDVAASLTRHEVPTHGGAAAAATEIAGLLRALTLPRDIHRAVDTAYRAFGSPTVSARSSALAEDTEGASFAGQYETVLGAEGIEALHRAILTCWRSFYSAQAIAARAVAGIDHHPAMAVLVQPLVAADCAGVSYSVDPVGMQRDTVVVSAAWGTGTGVVDGTVPADTYWLKRPLLDTDRREIAVKRERMVVTGEGVRREGVPAEQQRAACLPEGWVRQVAEATVMAERLFGAPQDMEWAIYGTSFSILQSRPITGLSPDLPAVDDFPVDWADPADARQHWSLWWQNAKRTSFPLETDYADLVLVQAWDDGARLSGDTALGEQRMINGRRYVARTPSHGDTGERRVYGAAVDGMKERMLQEHGLTTWEVWGPEIVACTERLHAFDRRTSSDDALAAHVEDAIAALHRHWTMHSRPLFPDPTTYCHAYAALTGAPDAAFSEEAWALAEGEPTVITEIIDALHELGVEARRHPQVAEVVRDASPGPRARLEEMPEAERFLDLLDRFLDRFGERNGSGRGSFSTVLTPTWSERPEIVLAQVAPHLDPASPDPAESRARRNAERQAEVERLCAACADAEIVAEFRKQYALARKMARLEEMHNHYIDQVADGQLRTALLEVARRLAGSGHIEAEDHIWWLHVPEILAALRGTSTVDLRTTVRDRQAGDARWSALTPAPALGVPLPVLPPRGAFGDDVTAAIAAPDGALRGTGGSAGRARGPARVLQIGDLTPQLQRGDVLVAVNAGPTWTAYFPLLAAIVLDEGSFGEHSAGIAREYGVPLVYGTRHATARIRDGDIISVDAGSGLVTIE